MWRAVRSNRAEALVAALASALPPADPFQPATVVVGGHLIARWLAREVAMARGIAAGLDVVTFDRFIEQTWGDAGVVALDRKQLAAAIASALADERVVRALPAVAGYLDGAPAGDRAGPRRVQLAEHVAELIWQYALTRPDWMLAFVAGRVPSELASDETAKWQAALLHAALSRLPGHAKYAPLPMLPWLRRGARLPAPKLAAPVFVFGMSFLQRAQLEALTDLAQTTDVTVYFLDPCEPLWDDVRRDAIADPLPLALWGRAARDTLAALVERTAGNIEDVFVPPAIDSAFTALLSDVLARAPAEAGSRKPEAGLTVLACPNARRELEIVAAVARARLDADPALRAHEIAVWIAGDEAARMRYLAQAPSAFEAVGVPCHLIDAPVDDRGRIGEAVLALLELPGSEMTRGDLLRVMTHPAVLARHSHVDAGDWVRWTERLGIAHGTDDGARAGTYLADHPGRFHWDQGVRRLALGAFMTDDEERGPARIAEQILAPEEVTPGQQASAATFALLVRSLCADAAWLEQHEAPLAGWADVFVELVDAYLERGERAHGADTARDVERVRATLAGIARVDLDGRPVGFREAREHAVRRLGSARRDRGEPLAAGVMIAPLAAMRAIPFRIAFIVGLDERGGFSANDRPSPLDVRREPRAGDVTPRDRDRQAFLEVLLGAAASPAEAPALYLSYVASEAKSGAALAPSSVVLELADALAPYLGCAASREALAKLTMRAPLHRFGGAEAGSQADRERWAVRARDAIRMSLRGRGLAVPDEDGLLVLLSHPELAELREALGVVEPPPAATAAARERPLSLANLRSFLEWPVQAWAQAVLGLDELPDDTVIDRIDEPHHVDRPARAMLLREVLTAQLRGADVEAAYDRTVRDLDLHGQFPVGVFAEAERAVDLTTLARWREALGPIAVGAAGRLAFGRAHSPNAELLPAIELELSGGRTVRLVGQTELLVRGKDRAESVIALLGKAEKNSSYHLRGALDHVVLAAAGLAKAGHAHVLLPRDGQPRRVDHDAWTQADALGYLAGLVEELLDAPHGYLLPFDHLEKALRGATVSRTYGDPTNGLGYGPIERPDGLDAPAEARVIAKRRLAPLVERMHGDHGFGGDK